MANINYTAEQINALLAAAETAAQPSAVTETVNTAMESVVGDLSLLRTEEKGSVVGAVNENFTNAGEGKQAIVAALIGMGQDVSKIDTFEALAEAIGRLMPAGYVDPAQYVERLIVNDDSVTPTGTYATSTYYDVDFGVKIGYCPDGSVLLTMKGGTSTGYENLYFKLDSVPDGVTLDASSSSFDTADPAGNVYGCRISGITGKMEMALDMSTYNSTYDYTRVDITLTEVAE